MHSYAFKMHIIQTSVHKALAARLQHMVNGEQGS